MSVHLQRLFVYGSLQTGGPNEHMLREIDGKWNSAYVIGRLKNKGWGAAMGYPGLVLETEGATIRGQVFSSSDLNSFWEQLDEFEGEQYERVLTQVTLDSGARVEAFVYVLRTA